MMSSKQSNQLNEKEVAEEGTDIEDVELLKSAKSSQDAVKLKGIADKLRQRNQHGKAIRYYKKADDIFEQYFGKKHSIVAGVLFEIASAYDMLGANRKQDALEYYRRALYSYKHCSGNRNQEKISNILYKKAKVHLSMEEYDKTMKCYEAALQIREKAFGSANSDIETARYLQEKGKLHAYLNEYSKALECYDRSLMITRTLTQKADNGSVGNTNDLEVATLLFKIGVVNEKLGRFQEALDNFLEALDIRKTILPFSHKDITEILIKVEEISSSVNCDVSKIQLFHKFKHQFKY